MSARLTIVLDDEDLYRRLKIKAAGDGVPMKDLIERGIRLVVGADAPAKAPREFDWDAYEAMLERIDAADEAEGTPEWAISDDLSDIKRHLYGHGSGPRHLQVAEERAEYSAK